MSVIEFTVIRHNTVRVPQGDSYKYNGKWGCVGRWLFNKLSKVQPYFEDFYRRVQIDTDSLIRLVYFEIL